MSLANPTARDEAFALLREDPTLTGDEIGKRVGRTDSWGRARRREFRAISGNGSPTVTRKRKAPEARKPGDPPSGGLPASLPPAIADDIVSIPEPEPIPKRKRKTKADADRKGNRWVYAGVGLVALVAAVVSYSHQQQLAFLAGEGVLSYLIPLSVDGLVGVSSAVLVRNRHQGKPRGLAAVGLVLGVVASIVANIASADPTIVSRLVAAWPPVALIICIELLAQYTRKRDPS